MNYLIEEQKQLVSSLVSHTKTLKKDTKDFDQAIENIAKMDGAILSMEQQQQAVRQKEADRILADKKWEAEQKLAEEQQRHREEMDKAEEKRKQLERITAIEQWEAEQQAKQQEMTAAHTQFMVNIVVNTAMRLVEDALFVDLSERTWMYEEHGMLTTKVWQGLQQRIPWLRRK